jgi:hypothetical protein
MVTLSIARQQLGKDIFITIDTHTTKRDIVGDGVFNAVSAETI